MGELAHADAAQAELAEHGPRPATALAARVAPHLELRLALGLGDQRLLGHVVFVTSSAPLVRDHRALREPSVDLPSRPEGKAQCGEQRPALLVGLRRGHHGDVHAPDLDDAVVVDLGEDQLLGQPEGEVAVPVEAPGRQPAEVADAGQRHRHQPVQELPHPVTAQRDLGADRLALADLETGDRLLGLGDLRLLPGDRGQVAHGAVELARLADGVAHAHVDHDLDRPGHLHDVLEPQLLPQPLPQLGRVLHLEPRNRDLWCGCRLCHVGLSPRLRQLGLRQLQLRVALGAHPELVALLDAVGDAGRLAAGGAHDLDVGGVQPCLLLGDAAGLATTLGGPDLLVALHAVDALDQHLVASRVDPEHTPGGGDVLAGHHHHTVVLMYPHCAASSLALWGADSLQHLRGKADDLHEALVPQLTADWAEDARATRVLLLVDDDGGVLVEADVGAVGAALLLLRAHDDRPDHVAFLDRAARNGVLHRGDDDVADGGVAPPGAAEHADAQDLLGTRVVGDLESRLLLDHLLGPLHDLGHPPALARRQGTGLGNADEVTHLGVLLVVGLELGRPPDRLAIQAVLAQVLDLHHHRLLLPVGDDHTEPCLALATGAGGRRRRFLVRHCLSPLSYLRRPSLRLAAGRTVATAVGTASPASSRCRMAVRMRAMSLRTSPSRWPFSS